VTDTDLITAGESTDTDKVSAVASPDTSDVADAKSNAPASSLATMVLPELRALANQAGVKGTSGMRKNELIAAIQESRGLTNGKSSGDTAAQDTVKTDAPAQTDAAVQNDASAQNDAQQPPAQES
jgi:transcription termination factor Rho